jgi:hypothetical protein
VGFRRSIRTGGEVFSSHSLAPGVIFHTRMRSGAKTAASLGSPGAYEDGRG